MSTQTRIQRGETLSLALEMVSGDLTGATCAMSLKRSVNAKQPPDDAPVLIDLDVVYVEHLIAGDSQSSPGWIGTGYGTEALDTVNHSVDARVVFNGRVIQTRDMQVTVENRVTTGEPITAPEPVPGSSIATASGRPADEQIVLRWWTPSKMANPAAAVIAPPSSTVAGRIAFDDTLTALGVTNVQDAIVALYALLGSTPPVVTPALLSGALMGSSALAGALSVTRALSGQATGSGVLTASLTVEREGLSGSVVAAGLLTGSLQVTRALIGAIEGTSAVAGALSVTRPLSGTAYGMGAMTGALTVYDPSRPLNLHIDADIDRVGERDDLAAMALWLGTQEHFNIVGLTASAPDSNVLAYGDVIAAYEIDRPIVITHSAYPERYKTGAQLAALPIQGSKVDAPSAGYWTSGDAGYAAPHTAAQALIANALAYGDPDSADPRDKLWVAIQGGYTTLAQAAYEAVQLGAMPDFFRRIRVIGQPNYNSWFAPNAWNYLFNNIWPAAGTPGMFGDAWMLNGYLQWHAYNRDNGGSDTTFWNNITADSGMGDYLRSLLTRPGGTFTTPHFRAGDAGAWVWLISAKLSGNFDPTNGDNWCGPFRTYVGELWAAQTFGYGTTEQPQFPNPEGTTFSPTMWAPALTVNTTTAAFSVVDLPKFYEVVAEVFERYQRTDGLETTGEVALPGERFASFSMVAPTSGTEDEPMTFGLQRYGVPIVGTATVSLSDTTSISVTAASANPTTFDRTIADPGAYTLTINSVTNGLVGSASDTVFVNAEETGTFPTDMLYYYKLNEGTGTAINDSGAGDLDATLQTSTMWVDAASNEGGTPNVGIRFLGGTNVRRLTVNSSTAIQTPFLHAFIACDILTIATGTGFLMGKDNLGAGQRSWLFNTSSTGGTKISFTGRGATPTSFTADVTPASGWHIYEVEVNGLVVTIRRDGVDLVSGTLANAIPNSTAALTVGNRLNNAVSDDDSPNAIVGSAILYDRPLTSGEAAIVRNTIKSDMALKGVTLP